MNQSSYLTYFCYNFFYSANEKKIYEIKARRLRSQILTCFIFPALLLKEITVSFSGKVVIVEEELDGININDIENLKNSPRFVFIDTGCENLIIANDGGELTRNINQKKKSGVLLLFIDVHYVKNAVGESISSITMWNIVNQLGKHDFSCGAVVNNLKDRKHFLIK